MKGQHKHLVTSLATLLMAGLLGLLFWPFISDMETGPGEFSGYSAADIVVLKDKTGGEDRPPEFVKRGRNNRRILPDHRVRAPEDRHGVPAQAFTGAVPLLVDEHLPDHQYVLSATALGASHQTFRALGRGAYGSMSVPLDGEQSVTFAIRTIIDRGESTMSFLGTVVEHPDSMVHIVYNDGAISGGVALYGCDDNPSRHYSLITIGGGLYAMQQLDMEAMSEHDLPRPPLLAEELDVADDTTIEDEDSGDLVVGDEITPATVDIVVGYGWEGREADGGVAEIEARIIGSVDRMNFAFDNSEITGTLVLLGMIEDPDYLESDYADMEEVVYALNRTWGDWADRLKAVTDLREALGADLKAFITKDVKTHAGIAYVHGASSVTARPYLSPSTLTFCHELGHNFGAWHAWGDGGSGGETDVNAHWHAWRFRNGSAKRRTIMAYDWSWDRVPYFSNSVLTYELNSLAVSIGAVDGYDATDDATVDGNLVYGGYDGGHGPGYDGSNPELGADVARYFNGGTVESRAGMRSRAVLAVTYPADGETLLAWDEATIEWVGGTWHSPADIELYKGGIEPGDKVAEIAELSQNGYRVHMWTPGEVASGDDYRIRIWNNKGSTDGHEASAFSAVFTIDAPDTVQFASDAYEVHENAGEVLVSVTRMGIVGAISVDYQTHDATAESGTHYIATNGTLRWEDGDNVPQVVAIPIIDNMIADPEDPIFTVVLSNPIGDAAIHSDDTTTVTIIDNDVAPVLALIWPTTDQAAIPEGVGIVLDLDVTWGPQIADPETCSVAWTMMSGPGSINWDVTDQVQTAAFFSAHGTYSVRLTADDGHNTTTQDIAIAVGVEHGSGSDWSTRDIGGGIQEAGETLFDPFSQTYTIGVDSGDVWGSADSFHYAYQEMEGDGEIIAWVQFNDTAHPWAKAGVMMRETLEADSSHVSAMLTFSEGNRFMLRTAAGKNAANVGTTSHDNRQHWLRLVREAGVFRSYLSDDGITWDTFADPQSVSMASRIYVGLFLSSHTDGGYAAAQYSHVEGFGGPGNVGPLVSAGSDAEGYVGVPYALSGSVSDPDDQIDPETTLWLQRSGPGVATFAHITDPVTSVEFDAQGVYGLRLTAHDGAIKTYDDMEIMIEAAGRVISMVLFSDYIWHMDPEPVEDAVFDEPNDPTWQIFPQLDGNATHLLIPESIVSAGG